ncbi:NmrA/HSCARG family protein [Corallococcus sp. AS-1-6]|uniref:NmrA/HSCARG family protein n=1 Tax=Corallococcus sp. AS-1-6 TaxID=2874599 RepID=UPI001CC07240|nr:NmrA/HSCARG family protein [Corallococcus sp. AS-1-6]MBZ4371894.1 NmrA/HSCARG family protein [Corallococcus sp. AS-1-6]
MTMDKKIIAVVGATGEEGGSLARAILADTQGGFRVRALTRKPGSELARRLAKLGAEVVAADVSDAKSLKAAFTGAHGAFCVTSYWEKPDPERELAQARTMAHAAKEAGVAHVIWSTQEDTRRFISPEDKRMPLLKGHYRVPQFDVKGAADAYFSGLDLPVTFVRTSFSWENLLSFGLGGKRNADGTFDFVLPTEERKLPGIATEDVGGCVHGLFQRGPEAWAGRTVGLASEHLTGQEIARTLKHVLGQEVVFHSIEPEVYRTFNFPGAPELANMFQFMRDFAPEYCAARDPGVTRELNPHVQPLARWIERNKARFVRAA